MSPPHNVTNPSGRIVLHTPPSSFFHVLRQMSEDPQPGRYHRQGRRLRGLRQSQLLAPSLHTYVPCVRSPLSPSLLRLQAFSAHFVTTGLLPGSRPDIRHMSPSCPRPHSLKPDVVCGLKWRAAVTHPLQPVLRLTLLQ